MIICHCNNIREQEVIDFIGEYPDLDYEKVADILGIGSRCGRCRKNSETPKETVDNTQKDI